MLNLTKIIDQKIDFLRFDNFVSNRHRNKLNRYSQHKDVIYRAKKLNFNFFFNLKLIQKRLNTLQFNYCLNLIIVFYVFCLQSFVIFDLQRQIN